MNDSTTGKLTVGTRGSSLALTQTNWVVEELKSLHPGIEIDIKIIKTKGDKILDVPLAKIGDKGLFVKELEVALLTGEIDFAVHSMKDLPTELAEGLHIAAVPKRVDPSDVLISNGPGLAYLPRGTRIGSSSLRRCAQLHNYRADLRISDVRGNLDTRLRKLDSGEFDGIILAYAGLHRMGWTERVTEILSHEICLPAVGQGALAIEAREDDEIAERVMRGMNHLDTRAAVLAERSLMHALEGGCQVPIGALGIVNDDELALRGIVASLDGTRLVRAEVIGSPKHPERLGKELASALISGGADEILREVRGE